MKSRYLMSCAMAAVISTAAYVSPAMAADAAVDAASAADAAAEAPADGGPTYGEIVVTATRRNESIQKVPLTIQAFTGNTLKQLNVSNFNDLVKFTPNVTFGNNGPGTGAIFMRGLSTGFAGSQSQSTTGSFPNVALYLDDQSMQFPSRNADVYVADLERIEVLEGPQGTLFGGGAQAGAVRYITNKPVLDKFEGHFEGQAGGTAGGAPNGSFNAAINIPIVQDKLAVRAVIYDDHRGGYIDNVPGTFTRSDGDHYNYYFNNGGHALPPTQQSDLGQYNNNSSAKKDYNPADYIGGRVSLKWQVNDDWDVLISEMYQKLDTEGTFNQEPFSPDGVKLKKLQTVTFEPSYNKDEFWNTAWTVNGHVGGLHVVYTGAYMVRHIDTQQDYTNYSRAFGEYYQCKGGSLPLASGTTPFCYDPYSYWHDRTRNTHMSHELRVSTPADSRIRVIGGAFYEKFRIYDSMDFAYRSVPVCTGGLLASNTPCVGLEHPNTAATTNRPENRDPKVAFGEDVQRGYDQYAFFGSVDFDILSNLTITAGTRYYHYKEFETGSQFQAYLGGCNNVLVCTGGGPGDVNIDNNNDHVTYHGFKSRVSLNWKPTTNTIVFGTFSQGFRPGGFNRTSKQVLPGANGVPQFEIPNGYAPDKLTNWEVGVKTDLLDHKVQFNLSAYYMVWNNVQFNFIDPADGFGNTSFVINGADYHVKGVELQLTVRPTQGLSIQGSATYNDSKQVSSPCLVSTIAGSSSFGQCITQRLAGGILRSVQTPFGNVGSTLPFAPHFQGNLRARYDWRGPSELNFWVGTGVSYTGATFNQPANFPSGDAVLPSLGVFPGTTLLRYRMPAYALVDAQIGVGRDNWTLSIFGDNLTNRNASTFTSSAQYIKSESVVRPLTYGVKVTYDF